MELDRFTTQMETHIKGSGKKTHTLVKAPCGMQMEVVMKELERRPGKRRGGSNLYKRGAHTSGSTCHSQWNSGIEIFVLLSPRQPKKNVLKTVKPST
jgi:hypothetical protein